MAFKSKVLGRKLGKFKAEVDTLVSNRMREASRTFQQLMQSRLRGPTGSNTLATRTGALRRSVRANVEKLGGGYRVTFRAGANVPYARIHETGGAITAKRTSNLAIPLAAAKTKAGVSRLASPRQDPTLKFIVSKRGSKLLVRIVGKGANKRIIPHYVLKPSVYIPPRLGFKREADRVARETVKQIQQDFAALAKRGLKGGR